MERTDLRSFLTLARRGALGAALALPLIGAAQAQDDFPSQPIEIINMSSPGGGTDIFLRTLAICAQEELGTEIVVLSKTGGLGAAMINYAANRERDGHTLIALNVGAYVTAGKGKTPVKAEELIALVRGTEDPQFLIAKADSPLADAKTFIEEGAQAADQDRRHACRRRRLDRGHAVHQAGGVRAADLCALRRRRRNRDQRGRRQSRGRDPEL